MSRVQGPGPVTVFKTNDPALLAVAQSLLEEADIEFNIVGEALLIVWLFKLAVNGTRSSQSQRPIVDVPVRASGAVSG